MRLSVIQPASLFPHSFISTDLYSKLYVMHFSNLCVALAALWHSVQGLPIGGNLVGAIQQAT